MQKSAANANVIVDPSEAYQASKNHVNKLSIS